MAGLAILAGVGLTVSLLIGKLAFGAGSDRTDHVKIAVLAGSVLTALPAAAVLGLQNLRGSKTPPRGLTCGFTRRVRTR